MNAPSNILRLAIFALLLSRAPRSVQRVVGWMLFGALLAAVLIALATIAHSGEVVIPREYRGEWCMAGDKPYWSPTKDTPECRANDSSHKITANNYQGCRPLAVKPEDGGHVITFRCPEEGRFVKWTVRFDITTGTQGRGKRLYIEENNQ
jgi:hypothetical protein